MGIMEKMRLDGKRSFVTGGARGIGKAIATALAEAGSDVALLDVDIATARQAAAEIAQATGRVIRAYEVDVTQEAQVDAVVQQLIEDLGGLDCAFCNAGICLNVPAAEMTLAQWRKVIDINLTGVFLTARAAGKQMGIRKAGQPAVSIACYTNDFASVAADGLHGGLHFRGFSAVGNADYHIPGNQLAAGAVHGFCAMEEIRGCAGGGHERCQVGRHMARLADAGDMHPIAFRLCGPNQLCGGMQFRRRNLLRKCVKGVARTLQKMLKGIHRLRTSLNLCIF